MKYYLFIVLTIISCKKEDSISSLNFKSCHVTYPIYANGEKILYKGHSVSNKWELESAKYQLALCLCEEYLKKPDIEIKAKIIEIYKEEMTYYQNGYPKNLDFNIILKNRKDIFYSMIMVE